MNIITSIIKGFTITVGVIILLFICLSFLAAVPNDEEVDQALNEISIKVADDAVAKYYLVVENGGTSIDRCVQAGSVAAAFLQANDPTGYAEWLEVRKRDCAAAGIVTE